MDEKELTQKSDEYAKSVGIKLNPDKNAVNGVIKGLLFKKKKHGEIYCPCRVVTGDKLLFKKKKHGEIYCPCRVVTGDKEKDKEIICPCVFHRGEIELQGHCLCKLFFK
jgi:ferredoxin-thioredoxin reductase catalytic subunit